MNYLNEAANFLNTNKPFLISIWEERIRRNVQYTEATSNIQFREHIELLLNDLEISLRKVSATTSARAASEMSFNIEKSQALGVLRAQQGKMGIDNVLEEYIVLRQVITDQLKRKKLDNHECIEAVNHLFELASLTAVRAYSKAVNATQRKVMATLIHDIRSPISVAISAVQITKMKRDDDKIFFEFNNMAERSLLRSMDMVAELLDIFSFEAGTNVELFFEKKDIYPFVEEMLQNSSQLYGKNFQYDIEHKEARGVFSVKMIIRILENLISNAFKYGEIDSLVSFKMVSNEDEVKITVHNQGNPISEETKKNIFQTYQTTGSSTSKSWGLGLSYVKLVSEAHGGNVKLSSNSKDGTTFAITLKKNFQTIGIKKFNFNNEIHEMR